ncbi:MAG: TIGR03087 family PEP-CTERM/XrtA system glycosyltransferase [Phycisphaerae bacterium]|nr:TIGR03087 family PEP-CTERM/XrtA system glycosyltransferase [Phycisphaerae bacterium]
MAHRVPYPPNKGDKLRAFRQIEHLSTKHEIWCAAFADRGEDGRHVDSLRRWCAEVEVVRLRPAWAKLRALVALARGRTLTEGYFWSHAMRTALAAWSARTRFDAVFAYSSSMASYALGVPAGRRILDLCDLDSLKWQDYARFGRGLMSSLYEIEGRRLGRRERSWITAFDATLLITEAEASHLPLHLRRRVQIMGNGVTLGEWGVAARSAHDDDGPVIGFVGAMDYLPNVDAVTWFVRTSWPAIRARFPEARFRIVGHRPVRAVRRLVSFPGVEVVGAVADVQAEVRRTDVSVAPLRIARGLQNKVLEAMAEGVPVVLTPGAAEGIDGRADHDYCIAAEATDFAVRVVRLLLDATLRDRIGAAGRALVAHKFRWAEQLARLDEVLTDGGEPHRVVAQRTIQPDGDHPGLMRPGIGPRETRELVSPGSGP